MLPILPLTHLAWPLQSGIIPTTINNPSSLFWLFLYLRALSNLTLSLSTLPFLANYSSVLLCSTNFTRKHPLRLVVNIFPNHWVYLVASPISSTTFSPATTFSSVKTSCFSSYTSLNCTNFLMQHYKILHQLYFERTCFYKPLYIYVRCLSLVVESLMPWARY